MKKQKTLWQKWRAVVIAGLILAGLNSPLAPVAVGFIDQVDAALNE